MVATIDGDEAVIAKLHAKLRKGGLTLPQKYRILFSLRNCKNASAHAALLDALKDDSALLRHDVAFALGQRQDPASIATLLAILNDPQEHCMVRHEAAEALGAIGTPECLEPLKMHEQSKVRELAETCQLAKQRMEYFSRDCAERDAASRYQSVDPTPPFPLETPFDELTPLLLDEEKPLFDRYRALFTLRNKGGPRAVAAMAQCFRTASSALLKHEIAYVLGQMMDPTSVKCLKEVIKDETEHAMVRHEAAEALGAIADDDCLALLREFTLCGEPIVAHSCIVALDMIDHERSGAFEYADMGQD